MENTEKNLNLRIFLMLLLDYNCHLTPVKMLEYLWEFALFFGLMMGEQLKTVGNSLNKEVLYASKILKFRKLKCYHHSFNHYQNKYMSK